MKREDFKEDVTHFARGTYKDLMCVSNSRGDITGLRYSDNLR